MKFRVMLAALPLLMATAAEAHVGQHDGFSLRDGFLHPLFGLDHLTAMLAVGLWSAQGGGRRMWLWPAAFVTAMLAGGTAAHFGLALPFVEPSIAASLVILGILVILAVDAPVVAGAALVALFAIAHGHAHGTEAPSTGWAAYAVGFAAATALLHGAGLAAGTAISRIAGDWPVRAMGAVPVAVGVLALIR